MPAVGDLLQILMSTSVGGQIFQNVFHYACTAAGGGGVDELLDEFDTLIASNVEGIIHESGTIIGSRVKNLDNLLEFAQQTLNRVGNRTGELLPIWEGFTFHLPTTDLRVHNGRKNFGPIGESDQNGAVPAAALAGALDAVAGGLDSPLITDTQGTYVPIIWSPANDHHTGDLMVFPGVTQVGFVSTQNSRKPF